MHNIASVQEGKENIVVARRNVLANRSTCDFTACEFGKKWMSKKSLWRHTKTCLVQKEYYRTHKTRNERELQLLDVARLLLLMQHLQTKRIH